MSWHLDRDRLCDTVSGEVYGRQCGKTTAAIVTLIQIMDLGEYALYIVAAERVRLLQYFRMKMERVCLAMDVHVHHRKMDECLLDGRLLRFVTYEQLDKGMYRGINCLVVDVDDWHHDTFLMETMSAIYVPEFLEEKRTEKRIRERLALTRELTRQQEAKEKRNVRQSVQYTYR